MMQRFLAFSADVAAFEVFELQGTGQAQAYLDAIVSVVGTPLLEDLLDTYDRAPPPQCSDRTERDAFLRREIFGDARLGPVARNVVKLWYVGIWYELPRTWIDAYGARRT